LVYKDSEREEEGEKERREEKRRGEEWVLNQEQHL
jgi:hypothetical protein